MERYIDLKKLSLDELAGVINLYPWFGSARKELCRRMLDVGGDEWGKEQFADAAMYLPFRKMVSDMMHMSRKEDYADKDISAVLGITEKAVEYHITKALKALRIALKDYLPLVAIFLGL